MSGENYCTGKTVINGIYFQFLHDFDASESLTDPIFTSTNEFGVDGSKQRLKDLSSIQRSQQNRKCLWQVQVSVLKLLSELCILRKTFVSSFQRINSAGFGAFHQNVMTNLLTSVHAATTRIQQNQNLCHILQPAWLPLSQQTFSGAWTILLPAHLHVSSFTSQ